MKSPGPAGKKLQTFSPAHTRSAADHVDDALQFAMMVGTGLGIRMNLNRAGPYFVRTRPSVIDRCRPRHAGSLRGIEIESVSRNDFHSMIAPIAARFSAHNNLFFLKPQRAWT